MPCCTTCSDIIEEQRLPPPSSNADYFLLPPLHVFDLCLISVIVIVKPHRTKTYLCIFIYRSIQFPKRYETFCQHTGNLADRLYASLCSRQVDIFVTSSSCSGVDSPNGRSFVTPRNRSPRSSLFSFKNTRASHIVLLQQ